MKNMQKRTNTEMVLKQKFFTQAKKMKDQGYSDLHVARHFDLTTSEFRTIMALLREELHEVR